MLDRLYSYLLHPTRDSTTKETFPVPAKTNDLIGIQLPAPCTFSGLFKVGLLQYQLRSHIGLGFCPKVMTDLRRKNQTNPVLSALSSQDIKNLFTAIGITTSHAENFGFINDDK